MESTLTNVWHPFTQMQTEKPPIHIRSGKGSTLFDDKGNTYIDGISSWWVNLHGHAHPSIARAISEQAQTLEHVIFAGFTHAPALELASYLLNLLPSHFGKLFYSDNGSTAVEVALKIALQFWKNKSAPRKTIVSLEGAYHGDTFGAMALAGKSRFNKPFRDHLFPVKSIAPPLPGMEEASLEQLKQILEEGDVACFVFEPLVLAAGGMKIYAPKALDPLIQLCHEYGALTIADEVMTGFGRTGPLFASDLLAEKPQIVCLAKGLTGGFMPLAVTACTDAIYNAFLSKDPEKALLHGHSYCGNPIGCSAALASLEVLSSSDRTPIEKGHQAFCKKWRGHPKLKRCESLGTLLVLEFQAPVSSEFFLEKGVLLRPLQNVVYVLPPYCTTQEELETIYHTLEQLL